MAVTVNTRPYEYVHGCKPRQPYGQPAGAWAFQIDAHPEPLFIHARYREALKQAKREAKHIVSILP